MNFPNQLYSSIIFGTRVRMSDSILKKLGYFFSYKIEIIFQILTKNQWMMDDLLSFNRFQMAACVYKNARVVNKTFAKPYFSTTRRAASTLKKMRRSLSRGGTRDCYLYLSSKYLRFYQIFERRLDFRIFV